MSEATPTASSEDSIWLMQALALPVLVVRLPAWQLLYANDAARRFFGMAACGVGNLASLIGATDRRALEAEFNSLPHAKLAESRRLYQGIGASSACEAILQRAIWQRRPACLMTLIPADRAASAERESFYEQMFSTNPAIKLLIDPADGSIVDANAAAEAFYGYSLEMLKQLKISDINCLAPEEIQRRMAKAKACQQLFFEFRHRLANGEMRDVHVYSGPVTLDGREYLHSIIVDMTDQKRYYSQLEVYNDLFHKLPVGIYRNTTHPEPRFTAANPAMLHIFEAGSRQALFQARLSSFYDSAEQLESFMADLERDGAVSRRPLRLRTLKGRPIHVEVTAFRQVAEDLSVEFSGIVEDVTARHAAQVNRDRLTHLLDASPDIVTITDAEQRVVYLNKAGRKALGELPEALPEALRKSHPLWARRLIEEQGIPHALEYGHWYAETAVLAADGSEMPVSQLIVSRRSESGELDSIATIMRDISEAKRYQAELEFHAGHDPLTGAVNRNRFLVLLERARIEARRGSQPISLVMFDIDRFKKVNDTFGHSIGDRVLTRMVQICSAMLREVDVLAHWGGEEFMLLLPGTPLAGAELVAEALRQAIEEGDFSPVPTLTSSFGVAELGSEESDAHCYKRLDEALYRAKAEGRNRVCVAEPTGFSASPPGESR